MSRACALTALTLWEDTGRFAEHILDDLAKKFRLSGPDRGLAQEILYGCIRHLRLLDAVIDELRGGRIKSDTRNLLRVGLFQLLRSGIAEHAAINETVGLARPHEKKLVNAILRRAQRERAEIEADIATWPLAQRTSHPDFLVKRWETHYGADAATFLCNWNNQVPPVFARINACAADQEALNRVRSETIPCLLGPEFPDFFRVDGALPIDWIESGLIYVQDPSTSHACRLLDPQPGEIILDACAAPGGKTALLAALIHSSEGLMASDFAPPRLEQLRHNLDRLGLAGVPVHEIDWTSPDSIESANLPLCDAILLDVPCSNTGVMRRRIDVRWHLSEREIQRHAETQAALLTGVRSVLKPGGRIVYSTCSIDPVENEDLVAASGLAMVRSVSSRPWEDGFDGAFAALLRVDGPFT